MIRDHPVRRWLHLPDEPARLTRGWPNEPRRATPQRKTGGDGSRREHLVLGYCFVLEHSEWRGPAGLFRHQTEPLTVHSHSDRHAVCLASIIVCLPLRRDNPVSFRAETASCTDDGIGARSLLSPTSSSPSITSSTSHSQSATLTAPGLDMVLVWSPLPESATHIGSVIISVRGSLSGTQRSHLSSTIRVGVLGWDDRRLVARSAADDLSPAIRACL